MKKSASSIFRITQSLFCVPCYMLSKILFSIRFVNRGGTDLKKLKGPLIIAANHKSRVDPFLIAIAFPMFNGIYPIRFITADEYLRVRVLGGFLKSMGGIPAFLGQGIDKSLRLPKEILKSGGSVGIFPEGRVIRESRLGAAKIGVAVLAIETKAAILPVAVKRNGRFAFEIVVGEIFHIYEASAAVSCLDSREAVKNAAEGVMERISELYRTA